MRQRVGGIGIVLAFTLVAAACTGSSDSTTSAPATSTAPATSAPATTVPLPPSTEPPPSTTTTTMPEADGVTAPVVRSPLTGEFIYFVMTDRFENADPTNDLGGDPGGETEADILRHGFLPTDTGFYHGGDLAGVEARLDYIQSLGATAIWITPPLTNAVTQGNGTVVGSSAGYHGYWQVNYDVVDPHIGTNAELQSLVEAAHDRDMLVFMDVVLNHTGDVITYAEGEFAYRDKADHPFRDAERIPFDDLDFAGTGEFPDLDADVSFPYTPAFARPEDATLKSPEWLNDPIYYHNRGNSNFSGENSIYGDFFGLDDLFTAHPDVVSGMTDIHTGFLDRFGVDGFRVDTVKHVNDEFWMDWVPALTKHAADTGNPDFFMFGEVFGESPSFRSHYTTGLEFPSLLDFGFNDAAVAYVANNFSGDVLSDFFDNDDWYTDDDSNASMLVKFAGNHDVGRIGMFIRNGNPGVGPSGEMARMRLAMVLMFLTRGIPVVYYGDEQGFVGDGGDQGARQDMFPSLVESYNDDDLIGTPATTAESNFDPTHRLYEFIADLAALRAAHPTLVSGAQIERHVEEGVYAFSRIDRDERVEYVIAVNNAPAAKRVGFTVATPDAEFVPLLEGEEVASDAAGFVEILVPGLSAVAYQADRPVPPSPAAPGVRISRPDDGAVVELPRFRLQADLDRNAFAEVTFAVSVDGGLFQVLGTDDSPPYRVYWDNSALPDGTAVELLATVDDLSGNTAFDRIAFTLGDRTR